MGALCCSISGQHSSPVCYGIPPKDIFAPSCPPELDPRPLELHSRKRGPHHLERKPRPVYDTARKLMQYCDDIESAKTSQHCVFYLALSLHPSALPPPPPPPTRFLAPSLHPSASPLRLRAPSSHPSARFSSYSIEDVEEKLQPSQPPLFRLDHDHHCHLTTDVGGLECPLDTVEMQTRALRMRSLLCLIGSNLAEHDRSTLLKTAFLDGFDVAYCLCNGKADKDCRGDNLYAALSTAIFEWPQQLLEISSTNLPYNPGAIPPKVAPRETELSTRSYAPCGEAQVRKLNVYTDYLDLLKPPIDGFIVIPANEHTRFIVEQMVGHFVIGNVDWGVWKVGPRPDDLWRALEVIKNRKPTCLRAARNEGTARQQTSKARNAPARRAARQPDFQDRYEKDRRAAGLPPYVAPQV